LVGMRRRSGAGQLRHDDYGRNLPTLADDPT
jgi:hypothetical protein